MDAGVVGDVNLIRELLILGSSSILDASEGEDVLAYVLSGGVGIDPPAAVRAHNPWGLSSMLVSEVLIDGLATSHDESESRHGQITTVRPLSFITGHHPSVARPVARPSSVDPQDRASDCHVKAMIVSPHVVARPADTDSVPTNVTSQSGHDSNHMSSVLLTSKAISMGSVGGLTAMSCQVNACSKRAVPVIA